MRRLRSGSRPGLLSWMPEPTETHPVPTLGPCAPGRPPARGLRCSCSFGLGQLALAEPPWGAGSSLRGHPAPAPGPAATEAPAELAGTRARRVALGNGGQPPRCLRAAPAPQPGRAEPAGIGKQSKTGAICRGRNCFSTLET